MAVRNAVISVGSKTWEFDFSSGYGGCDIGETMEGDVAMFAGDVNADETRFSAILIPDGVHLSRLSLSDHPTGEEWVAENERELVPVLYMLPVGLSQVDTIILENGHAWGQATFIEYNAASWEWRTNPPSVAGTFDIVCGG